MKKVKFRLVKEGKKDWKVQEKNFLRWKTMGEWHGSNAGSIWLENIYKSKKEAIKGIYDKVPLKKDEVILIQYPTLKYL